MTHLKLEKLNVYYDDFHAVKNVSISIERKEIVTLLGPSGCGKTSILRTIAGFNKPRDGKLILGDQEITEVPPQNREMGMIFQNYAIWPHMSIHDNIGYGLKIRKKGKEFIDKKVDELLTLVELEGQQDKFPTQLSGGQQQRVALARAIAIKPEVLLCDEPLSNLDFKLRVGLRNQIRDLAKKLGIAVVYVTHDQTEALAISDKIAIMNEGEIIQIGSPIQVYEDPNTLFVATFIGENNILEGKVVNVKGTLTSILLTSGETISVTLNNPVDKGTEVTVLTRHNSIRIDEDGNNILEGTLRLKSFMGSHLEVFVTLADGKEIIINESEKILYLDKKEIGSKMKLVLPEEKLLVFKDDVRVR